MKKKKIIAKFEYVIMILSLIIFASISIITFAWFIDKEQYLGNLTFGSIELDITKGVSESTKSINFDVTRLYGDYQTGGKIMPGDTVNIPLEIKLKENCEPAYYLVQVYDTKNVFENAYYFSDDGTNIYVNDGTSVYNQSTKEVSSKIVGKLSAGDTHSINIGFELPLSYTTKIGSTDVFCYVCAIQQANMSEGTALSEMLLNSSTDTDKKVYTQVEYLQSDGSQYFATDFYIDKTKDFTIEYSVKWTQTNQRQLIGYNIGKSGWWGINSDGSYQAVGSKKATISASTETFDNVKLVSFVNSSSNRIINMYVNDTLTYEISPGDSEGFLKLFAAYSDGGTPYYYNYCQMKILSIKQEDLVVHKFTPAIRNSDNKVGMLDAMTGRFYTNQGTGEFLWG